MNNIVDDILFRAKIPKNVLMISDNFSDDSFKILQELLKDGDYYFSAESNYFSFNISLVKNFDDIIESDLKHYDAFLIDYGILGLDKHSLNLLKCMTDNFGCVIWCGGLSGRYCDDVKRMFPDMTFLHDLPECSISSENIKLALYKNLDSNTAPSEFTLRCIDLALKVKK